MRVTFQGGTPRQRDWVNEALGLCTYPLDALAPVVSVNWANQFPANADTRHPYMVAVPRSDGSYLITIATWADDWSNPNNQGLANPRSDIKDFYMQSFVHELGHVVIDSTFNPRGTDTDPRVQTMCGLFWRPTVDSGSGRRLGTPGDWDAPALAWADTIREAVAEVFKCAFFSGRLLFMNRTNWRIDASNWANFLALISQPGGEQPVGYDDTFPSSDLSGYVAATDVNGVNKPGATMSAGAGLSVNPGGIFVFAKSMPLLDGFDITAKVGAVPVVTRSAHDGGGTFGVAPVLGIGDLAGDRLNPPPSLEAAYASDNFIGDQFPYWLRLFGGTASGNFQTELWDIDPWSAPPGSSPISFDDWSNLYSRTQPVPVLVFDTSGEPAGYSVAGNWLIDELRVRTFKLFTAAIAQAPYPFGDPHGNIAPARAAQGQILIGR